LFPGGCVAALIAALVLASPAHAHGTLPTTTSLTFGPSGGGGFFFGSKFTLEDGTSVMSIRA